MKTQTKNTVNVLTSLLLVLLAMMPTNSQVINGFKVQAKMDSYLKAVGGEDVWIEKEPYFITNYFSASIIQLDIFGNKKILTQFSENFPCPIEGLSRPVKVITGGTLYPQFDSYWNPGLWVVNAMGNGISNFISFEDYFGVPPNDFSYANRAIEGINMFYLYDTASKPIANCYCLVMPNALRWFLVSKPDSLVAEYKYAEHCEKPITILSSTSLRWGSSPFDMFFLEYKSIVNFDCRTSKFIVYDYENLPMPVGQSYFVRPQFYSVDFKIDDSVKYGTAFMLSKQGDYNEAVSNTVLLIRNHTDSVWNTIPINPPNAKYYDPLMSSLKSYTIEGSKVIMSFTHNDNTDTMLHTWTKTEIVIYDLLTQKYQCIQIPPELIELSGFDDPDEKYGTTYPRYHYTKDYVAAMRVIDNNILAILLENGYFLYYSLNTGIEDTEEGRFQEIGINSVYPNPTAPNRHVTANIMCYVPDISKVELGLYNFMGQKILDLNNQFEYSEATHTINITFAVPKELPRGVYFLNVRKGTETRTKTIIVVGE